MIHNDIHQELVDISSEQGWNEESQIQHLCGYLTSISNPVPHFREYLLDRVAEENEGIDWFCEKCGDACSHHPELLLCENCFIEAASK